MLQFNWLLQIWKLGLMKRKIAYLWVYLFAFPWFSNLNKALFYLSIRGLGILNFDAKNEYISGEFDWVKRYLKKIKDPVVFDVGANVGRYSDDVLLVSPKSKIYAFEPHPKIFSELTKKANFQKYNKAIGDQSKQIKLYDYDSKDGSAHASLYRSAIETLRNEDVVFHLVDMITLDDFCSKHQIDHIDLLKLDTEGHELQCLLGAKKILQEGRIKAIQFEFNEMNIVSKSTFKDFWDLLKGFKFYRLLPGGRFLEIKKYSPLYCEIYSYQNIVALKY